MSGMRFYYSPSRDHTTFRTPLEFDVPLSEPNDWRPLAVIDPEDDAEVARLREVFRVKDCLPGDRLDDWQAALREFADPKPPKPAEPTGLGAVVEDSDGSLMVRTECDEERPWTCAHGGSYWNWAGIDAVRVLSEGVTP